MRNIIILLLFVNSTVFCQNSVVKKFEIKNSEIELDVVGLDEIKIVNTLTNSIEIKLYSENENSNSIITKLQKDILKVKFKIDTFNQKLPVFRKFITRRLNRSSAIISIPKNKTVSVFGTNIDVISKSYKGDLNIYIDKGLVNLNTIQKNVVLKLFQGNIHGKIINSVLDLKTRNGSIKVNDKEKVSPYIKKSITSNSKLTVVSINANIFIKNN